MFGGRSFGDQETRWFKSIDWSALAAARNPAAAAARTAKKGGGMPPPPPLAVSAASLHLHRSFRVREVMMKTIRATLAIFRRWTRQVWRSRRRLRRGEATEEKQEEEAGSAARSRLSLRAFENCLIFFLVLLKYFIGSWWWVGRGKEVGRKKRLRTKNKPIRGGYFSILLSSPRFRSKSASSSFHVSSGAKATHVMSDDVPKRGASRSISLPTSPFFYENVDVGVSGNTRTTTSSPSALVRALVAPRPVHERALLPRRSILEEETQPDAAVPVFFLVGLDDSVSRRRGAPPPGKEALVRRRWRKHSGAAGFSRRGSSSLFSSSDDTVIGASGTARYRTRWSCDSLHRHRFLSRALLTLVGFYSWLDGSLCYWSVRRRDRLLFLLADDVPRRGLSHAVE